LIEAADDVQLVDALRWAAARSLPAVVLGGGSNLVVSDAGYDGVVIAMAQRGVGIAAGSDGTTLLRARAGEPWDALVELSVEHGLWGLECLSGIPGLTGATPIQNVGAYGQEVADVIAAVSVLDRRTLTTEVLLPASCGFGYRDSSFKRDPGRYVVLDVTFALRSVGPSEFRYAELKTALAARGGARQPRHVREAVLALRRAKSMVIDPADENRRSAGSFFTNPIVDAEFARRLIEQVMREGWTGREQDVPRYDVRDGRVKLAAGWLVERAGGYKGERCGAVGISTKHALALVQHGGASSAELLAFARAIRDRVLARFGVELVPEPVFIGFPADFRF
jgi:UDP-N-acetylmuramate dehydrogenase